jgi:hypothetical protein
VINGPDNLSPFTLLGELNDHFSSHLLFVESEVIDARVPIIKGVDRESGLKIDISVNNVSGVLNIERHQNYLKIYPALFPLLMFLKFCLWQYKLDTPFDGGISSNTLLQMVVFIIQSAPTRIQMHCGELLMSFLKCFGEHFNYITTGITTKDGGRLFSRIDERKFDVRRPFTLCIEDPQVPGSFLGGNAWLAPVFREKCFRAAAQLKERTGFGYEQSMLGRVVFEISVKAVLARRTKDLMAYNRLWPIDCFPIKRETPIEKPPFRR